MTKIDIFSGFLGAGKTTLIKKLIKESFAGQKVVLIENEFGEIGIDGGFLKESGIQINELNAGCICCSLVGDFRAALQQVVEQYHPDRIVIEPSGVGKLSDVTRAVEGVAEHLDVQLSSFVTVADVNKVKMYMKNFGEFYDDQISHASCIILSRTQNATEEKIAAAVAMLREKNPTATIVTTAWDSLTGEQILKAMSTKDDFKAELIAMAAKANEEHAHEDEEEEHEHHHDHEDGHDHCCCGHHHDHDDDDDDTTSMSIITTMRTTTIIAAAAITTTTTKTTMTMTSMSIITTATAAIITTTMTTTPTRSLPAGASRRPRSSPRLTLSTPSPSWTPAITA